MRERRGVAESKAKSVNGKLEDHWQLGRRWRLNDAEDEGEDEAITITTINTKAERHSSVDCLGVGDSSGVFCVPKSLAC